MVHAAQEQQAELLRTSTPTHISLAAELYLMASGFNTAMEGCVS